MNRTQECGAQSKFEGLETGEVASGYPLYKVSGGRTLMGRVAGRGKLLVVDYVELANFVAVITRQIVVTDGRRTEVFFELEGVLASGKPFQGVRVKASEFCSMNWVLRCLGAGARVAPGRAAKDCLRHAIQAFSEGRFTTEIVSSDERRHKLEPVKHLR
jgi:hypothetical protein